MASSFLGFTVGKPQVWLYSLMGEAPPSQSLKLSCLHCEGKKDYLKRMKQRWNYGSLEDSSQTKKTEIERLIVACRWLPVFRDDSIRPACWTTNTKPRIDLVEEEPIPTPKFRRHAAIFEFWFIRHWDVTFSSDASAVEVLVQQNRSVCPWKRGFRKNHLKLCKTIFLVSWKLLFMGRHGNACRMVVYQRIHGP